MFLKINPHAAAATLCAQRDSTLSLAPDGSRIACLPFFNSNLPEYLPDELVDEFSEVYNAYAAPLVSIKVDLMNALSSTSIEQVNARIERMLLCNRPALYSSLESPRYLSPGAASIGEPALLYHGLYPKVLNGQEAYKVNRVLIQQMLLCSGRGQTRRGGPKQNSSSKPRQDGEGAITNSVISAHALQLSMCNTDIEDLTLKLYRATAPYRTSTEGDFSINEIAWASDYDSRELTDEPDGVTVDSARDSKLWNGEAPMVHPVIKRGRFESQYTFVSEKSERDVDRVDQVGCGDWSDHNMYTLLKDYVDEYGYNRSQFSGNVVPASSTQEEADKNDTPAQHTKHYAHACSPCIEDAICRVVACQLITMAIAYDGSSDGAELRRLWSTSPATRMSDDDQQKLKLMLLKLPSALPMFEANATYPGAFLTHVIDGGGQLSETASMAAACEIHYEINFPGNIAFSWDLLAGRPDGLNLENPGARGMLNILTNGNTVSVPPMRTRPIIGNAGFSASKWEESAQGIVFNPNALCHSRNSGAGNTIAYNYGVCTWSSGKPCAITAMGSIIELDRSFASEMPPQHLTGHALGVAEVGVNGYAENGLSAYASEWDEATLAESHFVFFFTNGGV